MKSFKQKRVAFLLFEETDQWVIKPLVKTLRQRGIEADVLSGFCYNAAVKNGKTPPYFRGYFKKFIRFRKPENCRQSVLLSLLKEKINSRETRIVFFRVLKEIGRLRRYLARTASDMIVVPESIRAAHGHLALVMADKFKIKSCVTPPLYYEWITTRPWLGAHKADKHIVRSYLLTRRLRAAGVRGKITPILPTGFYFKKQKAFPKVSNSEIKFVTRNPFFIAALQNNPQEELFISLLISTFERFPDKILVIKFHPSSPREAMSKVKSLVKEKNILFSDVPFGHYITQARAMLTLSSTAALLAVGEKIPVITAHLDFFYHELEGLQKHYKCLPSASNPDELGRIIRQLEVAKFRKYFIGRQEKLRRDFFKTTSTQRAVQSIMSNF